MAIARDATSGVVVGSATGSLTTAHTISGSDRALIVHCLSNNGSNPITGVTYNGTSMTKLSTFTRTGESFAVDQYGIAAPDTGTNNVVITASGTATCVETGISYTGVDQTTPFPTTSTAIGNSATISDSLTVSASNSWIFAGTRTGGAQPSATGTNYTRQVSNASNGVHAGDSNAGLSTGSQTVSVSVTSGSWGIAIIEIAEAGAATSSISSITSVAQASITSYLGVANASIASVNGIANS